MILLLEAATLSDLGGVMMSKDGIACFPSDAVYIIRINQ